MFIVGFTSELHKLLSPYAFFASPSSHHRGPCHQDMAVGRTGGVAATEKTSCGVGAGENSHLVPVGADGLLSELLDELDFPHLY